MSYEVDAYPTDHGWVFRLTRLNRFGEDDFVQYGALGTESRTEEEALQRGIRNVLEKGGKVRRITRLSH